jgi:hypothetical protein
VCRTVLNIHFNSEKKNRKKCNSLLLPEMHILADEGSFFNCVPLLLSVRYITLKVMVLSQAAFLPPLSIKSAKVRRRTGMGELSSVLDRMLQIIKIINSKPRSKFLSAKRACMLLWGRMSSTWRLNYILRMLLGIGYESRLTN